MKKFAGLICNFLPSGCRLDTLEKKEYTVVPMVILTEGVHTGSQGPLYYPQDELSKTPVAWNHKPIVIYHPTTMGGDGISACSPEVLNTRKIGVMLNTKFEDGKLKSEAWIDAERADEVDERIMIAINSKEMMELSTGVFIDVEETSGQWKSEDYTGIARNFRPDHLALLPDQIGACSIADGAGLLRNVAHGKKSAKGKDFLAALEKLGLVVNEMSYSNIHSALSTALREKFPPVPLTENICHIWVADVYSNFCVYEKDGKLWRLGYMSNNAAVSLSDETPVEVKRVTEYRTVNGNLVGNQVTSTKPENNMNIKETVDGIIAQNKGWAEADREMLMKLKEPQLTLIVNSLKEPVVAAPPAIPAGPVAPPVTPVANATLEAPKKPITLAEYVAGAPKEVSEVLTNGIQIYNEEKTKLVDAILANENNGFTKEDLSSRPLNELRNLARLAAASNPEAETVPHYAGQAPVGNKAGEADEVLEVPTMNFDKKAA